MSRAVQARYVWRSLSRCALIAILAFAPMVACGGGGGRAAARPVSTTLDDATITTRVKTALLNDPGVAAQKIDVNASSGVVTLSGVVKTQDEIARAIELAKKIQGVTDVKSSLTVQP